MKLTNRFRSDQIVKTEKVTKLEKSKQICVHTAYRIPHTTYKLYNGKGNGKASNALLTGCIERLFLGVLKEDLFYFIF